MATKGRAATKKAGNGKLGDLAAAGTEIVDQAASLLDEEIVAGIDAAKRIRQRLQDERRVSADDLRDALDRFQHNAHEVVTLLEAQLSGARAEANTAHAARMLEKGHDLVDLTIGFVTAGTEIVSSLLQKTGGPSDAKRTARRA